MRINAINRIYEMYNAPEGMAAKSTDKSQSKDEVDLSSIAKDFSTIRKMVANEKDIREDKVKEIKDKMANGTYDVTAKQVAEKILAEINFKG